MKSTRKNPFLRALPLHTLTAFLIASPLSAATVYWDTNSTTAGSGNADGAWDAATTNWGDSAGTATTAAWVSGDTAAFAAGTDFTGTRVITVSGTRSIAGILVDSEVVTLTLTGGTLDFGALQGSIDTSAWSTATGKALNINSVLTGTNGLTIASNGNLTATGGGNSSITRLGGTNTFTGDVTITAGLVAYTSNAAFGDSANKIVLNGGGLLDPNTNIALSRDIQILAGGGTFRSYGSSNVTWSGAISGSGTINRTDGGTLTLSGSLSSFTGTYNNQGGNTTLSGNLSSFTGTYNNQAGTTTLTGTAAATIGGTWTISAGTLSVNSTATQSLGGTVSGAGVLSKSGSGTLTLSGNNSGITGGVVANGGVLSVSNIADTGTTSQIGNLATGGNPYLGISNGGTFSYTSTAAASTARSLWVDTGVGGTIDISDVAGSLTFTGTLGNQTQRVTKTGLGSLTLDDVINGATGAVTVNAGTFNLRGINTYTGTTLVNGGTLALTGATGAITSATATTIASGGSLRIDNSTASVADRFGAGAITLSGGTLDYFHGGAAATNYSETLGVVSVASGGTISTSQAAVGQTSTLTLGGLVGSPNFTGTGLGLDARNRIFITGRVNGATVGSFNTTGVAVYDTTLGVVEATFTDVPFAGTIADAAASNIRLTGGVSGDVLLAGTPTTVNSILQNQTSATTIDNAAQILRLGAAGGILLPSGAASLTIGTAADSGTLTAGGAPATAGTLTLTNNDATAILTANSVIADNGAIVSVVTSGPGKVVLAGTNTYTGTTAFGAATTEFSGGTQTLGGIISGAGALLKTASTGTLTLSGANTYSGATTINAGTLRLGNAAGLGSSSLVTVASGATLDVAGFAASRPVIIAGTGVGAVGALNNKGCCEWVGDS